MRSFVLVLAFALATINTATASDGTRPGQKPAASVKPGVTAMAAKETKLAKAIKLVVAPIKAATTSYTGRVLSPAGPLAGAVVEVTGTKLMTVTNAEGEFTLTLPTRRSPVRFTASYAGFKDETLTLPATETIITLELATPKVIKLGRDQEMETYLVLLPKNWTV